MDSYEAYWGHADPDARVMHAPCTDGRKVKEWRIFGPPGTGKTTELSKRVMRTCQKFGSASVICMSFTKTAAVELAGRDLPLDKERVGTLHSFAFRSIGCPEIAETAKHIKGWNATTHLWQMEVAKASTPGGILENPLEVGFSEDYARYKGDLLLAEYSQARTRLIPTEKCRPEVRQFAEVWERWKEENNLADFTDLIARAFARTKAPPVPCRVLYADEVQDFSPLELALVRKWGASCEYIVLAGDDDQTIYSFRGSVPDAFLDPPVPSDHRIVLPVSYRLPANVKRLADQWISRVSRREEKEWSAREGDPGSVQVSPVEWRIPAPVVSRIIQDLARDSERTVMVLTSCGYMLDPIIRELRVKGVPFHNPYRVSQGAWNPVGPVARRVLEYLCADRETHEHPRSRDWRSVWAWLEHLDAKKAGLRRGAKKTCKELAEDPERGGQALKWEDFTEILGLEEPPPRKDLNWLEARLMPSKRDRYAYTLRVCRTKGARTLALTPRVIVGTIHSVKGGQADTVFLFPDLSRAGELEWNGNREQRDSILRLFYVGMTRARERLVLCNPSDQSRFVPWR